MDDSPEILIKKNLAISWYMKEICIDTPNILIFVGGLEANLESNESAVGWWSCNWVYKYGGSAGTSGFHCMPNQIVVCDGKRFRYLGCACECQRL